MFDLPPEIQMEIYAFDSTFREKYDICLKSIKKASRRKFKIKFVDWNTIFFSEKKCFQWTKKSEIVWRKRPISIFGHYFLLFVYLDLVWDIEYKYLMKWMDKWCDCEFCNQNYVEYLREKS